MLIGNACHAGLLLLAAKGHKHFWSGLHKSDAQPRRVSVLLDTASALFVKGPKGQNQRI